jgi:hypothetical protein
LLAGKPYYIGPYLISPHPNAPHFQDAEEASKIFNQIVNEMGSANFNPNKEASSLMRELGFVSLFYFINGFLMPYGPYQALDDSLSLDMCNFRQSEYCLQDGARAACFMPRGFSKSRVFTHGGGTWDLLRDPDEQMLIVNAIYNKAEEFIHIIERNFDSNDLIKQFYPDYVPGINGGSVNKDYMVLPNRTRNLAAPSLKCFGMTGAAEGGHFSTIHVDDLVGLDSIDARSFQINAVMETSKRWFHTNMEALRLTLQSREIVTATRYALDDCYEDIYASPRSVTGWQEGDLQPIPGGRWDIYYRLVEENGIYLRPEVMDKEQLDRLLATDPWTAQNQYYNSPGKSGLAEFAQFSIGEAQLFRDRIHHDFIIRKGVDNFSDEIIEDDIRLRDCDVLMSTDIAATAKGINAKTCRTSIGVWAFSPSGDYFRIWSKVGFFTVPQTVDFIFQGYELFEGKIRGVAVEMDGPQKMVKDFLEKEMLEKGKYLPLVDAYAGGDKTARIRLGWGPKLVRSKVYAVTGADAELRGELKLFPMSEKKVDVLDESEKAFRFLTRPETREERVEREQEERAREDARWRLGAVGY